MPRIHMLLAMSALLAVSALTSGCYTLVGYPPGESLVEEESGTSRAYRDYEYRYDYTYPDYYGYNYDPYYSLWHPYYDYYRYSPYYDYYRYYPGRYYDDDYYVPEKKPETRRRGTREFRSTVRPERKSEGRPRADDEDKQPSRETLGRQRSTGRSQRLEREGSSASGSERRSTGRERQIEEKEE